MLLWMSSGVEVVAVGVRKLDVQAGAAFEFADACRDGSEVFGGLGEGEEPSRVSEGTEVVDHVVRVRGGRGGARPRGRWRV